MIVTVLVDMTEPGLAERISASGSNSSSLADVVSSEVVSQPRICVVRRVCDRQSTLTPKEEPMHIKITPNDRGNPPGKLADAELHFTDGPLEGLKLIGFSIWERRGGSGRNVTFPARQYAVNGERRSFALLRPVIDTAAHNRIRDLILEAYASRKGTLDSGPVGGYAELCTPTRVDHRAGIH